MQPPLTCGICGTGNRHGWEFDSHWSTYYRAIYCVGSNSDEPRLSGLAFYRESDEKNYLPPETHQRYDDLHLDPLSLITIQSVTPPGPDIPDSDSKNYVWGFRFHESCWKLIEQASMPQPVHLKTLWRILRSVPHSSHLPFWGHNFGGLYLGNRRNHQSSNHFVLLGGVSNLMIPSAYYDPFEVPELKTRLARTRIKADGAIPVNDGSRPPIPSPAAPPRFGPFSTDPFSIDPFSRLPPELREVVLTYVATEDLPSFRLSSRVIASIPLSQYFFKSRFWPGHELDVFFDGFLLRPSERAGVDWRELYRLSKERLKHSLVGLGERNRLRIWKQTIRPLTQAVDEVNRLSCLKGKSNWLQNPEDDPKISWKSIETSRSIDPELFGELNRQVVEAEIFLPTSKIEAMHVSLVEFFGKKFVSGLVFETEHGEDIELGYIMPAGYEDPLLVEGSLEGFFLAVDDCGFGAISPFTSKHMETEYLDWVGDRDELPIQSIRCQWGFVQRIRATFDGFRLQALYIPEGNNDFRLTHTGA